MLRNTFAALIAALLLCAARPAHALSPEERARHFEEMATHVGARITERQDGGQDVAGEYDGSAARFMERWDLYCDWAMAVCNKARREGMWTQTEKGNHTGVFNSDAGDRYGVLVIPGNNGARTTFQAFWLAREGWSDATSVRVPADRRQVDPRFANTPLVDLRVKPLDYGTTVQMNGAACFSPDGKTYAVGTTGGEILLFHAGSGTEIASWEVSAELGSLSIESLCYTPDGKTMISACSDGAVKVWDPDKRRLLCALLAVAPERGSPHARLNPAGTLVAIAEAGAGSGVYELGTGRRVLALDGTADCAAWAPDGRMIAVSHRRYPGHVVTALQLEGGEVAELWRSSIGTGCGDMAFSPDGRTLALGDRDGVLSLIDVASRRRLFALRVCSIGSADTCFSPDGSLLVSGTDDRFYAVVDAATGLPIARLWKGSVAFCGSGSIAFRADGKKLGVGDTILSLQSCTIAEAIRRTRLEIQQKRDTAAQQLAKVNALVAAGKLSATAAVLARAAVLDGHVHEHPALKRFLEGKISEEKFLKEFK